jgi:hypothetical protein
MQPGFIGGELVAHNCQLQRVNMDSFEKHQVAVAPLFG